MSDALDPLPINLRAHLARILPSESLATFAHEKPTAFWINALRGDVEQTKSELAPFEPEQLPWIEAYLVRPERRAALTSSDAFASGRIYVQSLSSLLAPMALAPRPGEEVLDLAAAPGGKTIRIAALMKNDGRIAAVEPIRGRFFKLRANLERCGVTIARTYRADGRSIGKKTPGRFDRVLLDAPCSSEARITARDPESWAHWSPRKIKECARKQRGLLESALDALRQGGVLVYCTCSFAPEENEGVLAPVLAQRDVEVEALELPIPNVAPPFDPVLAGAVRVLPTETMDGFFLCRLRKR
jgi:16S rRNA (cytosine1407-C5)-methyltransferase